MTTKEEDIVDHLVCARTHDDIYFFTNKGRIFASKVYELPATSRQSKGTPVVNIIQIGQDEKVTAILTVGKNQKNSLKYFIMATDHGQIKKTEIEKYENIRKTGIIAIGLKGKDELKWVKISSGNDVIVEVSEKGQAICYQEADVRPMGRSASGVTGVRLRSGDKVMSMDVVPGEVWPFGTDKKVASEPNMLIVLENGFGKRTMLKHFHIQKRGGMGIRAASCTARTGNVIGMHIVYSEKGDVVLASRKGQFIRMELRNIKKLGRDTQGVTLMRLKDGDKVSSVALISPEVEDESLDQPAMNFDEPKPDLPSKGNSTENNSKPNKPTKSKGDIGTVEFGSEPSQSVSALKKPNLNVKFYNTGVVINPNDNSGSEKNLDAKDESAM
jgi:DNA gyrase subunit A